MARCRTCAASSWTSCAPIRSIGAVTIDADSESLDLDLQYSLSDRIRYYWPNPDVQRACVAMFERLDRAKIPLTLLSQYLPRQYDAVRAGRLTVAANEILREGIAQTLRPYLAACGGAPGAAS